MHSLDVTEDSRELESRIERYCCLLDTTKWKINNDFLQSTERNKLEQTWITNSSCNNNYSVTCTPKMHSIDVTKDAHELESRMYLATPITVWHAVCCSVLQPALQCLAVYLGTSLTPWYLPVYKCNLHIHTYIYFVTHVHPDGLHMRLKIIKQFVNQEPKNNAIILWCLKKGPLPPPTRTPLEHSRTAKHCVSTYTPSFLIVDSLYKPSVVLSKVFFKSTTTLCNTMQHTVTHQMPRPLPPWLHHTATQCNTLQHTATYQMSRDMASLDTRTMMLAVLP